MGVFRITGQQTSRSRTSNLRRLLSFATGPPLLRVLSLALNLKAWFGLLLPNGRRGGELIKMEFRRFLHAIILLPAQIVRTGRRVIYRIMSYNSWLKDLFADWEHLRWLRAT